MKAIRTLFTAVLLVPALPAQAQDQSSAVDHALTLIHMFVRIAAESETSEQGIKAVDEILAGRNAAANEAFVGLMSEVLADVPNGQRSTIAAIGRDLLGVARKNIGAAPRIDPMQARKDLTAIGLTYHDSKQFLDAVKRNDRVAAELFIAGGAVDLSVTDFWGRDAVDLARKNGNEPLAQLILRSRRPARSGQPAPQQPPSPS